MKSLLIIYSIVGSLACSSPTTESTEAKSENLVIKTKTESTPQEEHTIEISSSKFETKSQKRITAQAEQNQPSKIKTIVDQKTSQEKKIVEKDVKAEAKDKIVTDKIVTDKNVTDKNVTDNAAVEKEVIIPSGSISLAEVPTSTFNLVSNNQVKVSLTSKDGFEGYVTLSAIRTDLQPIDNKNQVIISFSPQRVKISKDSTKEFTVNIRVLSDLPVDTKMKFQVKAANTIAQVSAETSIEFDLRAMAQVEIMAAPPGEPHSWSIQKNENLVFRQETTLQIINKSGGKHVIHGNGSILHQDRAEGLEMNQAYEITLEKGDDPGAFYCHDHEAAGDRMTVSVSP